MARFLLESIVVYWVLLRDWIDWRSEGNIGKYPGELMIGTLLTALEQMKQSCCSNEAQGKVEEKAFSFWL